MSFQKFEAIVLTRPIFITVVSFKIPVAVQPVTGIEGFTYQFTKEIYSILYSSKTSLQWAAPHLTLMYNLLYIWLSELGASRAQDNS